MNSVEVEKEIDFGKLKIDLQKLIADEKEL